MGKVMAKILFFGRLSQASDNLQMPLPKGVKDTDDLVAWLGRENLRFERLFASPGNRIAVNQVIISATADITDADEIAFMSPLSGG